MREYFGRNTALTTSAKSARCHSHVTRQPSEEMSVLVVSSGWQPGSQSPVSELVLAVAATSPSEVHPACTVLPRSWQSPI